jgi:hypothetical protein
MVVLVMALLSFKESTPGAYGLKASNAALSISTSIGTSPFGPLRRDKITYASRRVGTAEKPDESDATPALREVGSASRAIIGSLS